MYIYYHNVNTNSKQKPLKHVRHAFHFYIIILREKKHFLGIMYLQYNKSNLVLQMPNLHRLRYLHVYVFYNITITILIVMIHAKFDERLSIIIYTCISV